MKGAYTLHIDANKLAKLLRAKILERNETIKNPLPVKSLLVYEQMIEHYFRTCVRQAISYGEAVSLPFIGNMQVVQVISKKGYKWDQKYNGKDYELKIESSKNVIIHTDQANYPAVMRAVDRGTSYSSQVINYSERLDEILSLLNGKRTGKRKRVLSQ